jgi:hypothetical protein
MQMRWEEIEADWNAMTRRVRADRSAAKPDTTPPQMVADTGRDKVTADARSIAGVLEGSMP